MDREELCLVFDQLIKTDDTFLNKKTKLYCEYCLSLGKEYINSIRPGLYEECEKFNISNNKKMEDLEKQFITSCVSTLTQEGKEICEDILIFIGLQDEMLIDKDKVFCEYFLNHKPDGVETTEIDNRCKKYLEDLANFHHYKHTFKQNTLERERLLDMKGMRLKNL